MVKLHILIPTAGSDETFLEQAKLKDEKLGNALLINGEAVHLIPHLWSKPSSSSGSFAQMI